MSADTGAHGHGPQEVTAGAWARYRRRREAAVVALSRALRAVRRAREAGCRPAVAGSLAPVGNPGPAGRPGYPAPGP